MEAFLAGLALTLLGAAASLLARGSPRWSSRLGAGGAVAGALVAIVPAARIAFGAPEVSLNIPWSVPMGTLALGIDPLSAFFLLPVFVISALAAVYGAGYLGDRTEGTSGGHWALYNLFVAAMAVTIAARNGLLFLVAWEVMSIAAYFLVMHHDDHETVREAGRIYLIATHIGTAFLIAMFVLMARGEPSLDFDRIAAAGAPPGISSALFLMALLGFGAKAGLVPLHVWLPEAHPAAPSHVSAVMSGVMINAGIYGLIRTLTFLGPPPSWWGWALSAIGLLTAIFGILFALAQRDMKRMLAYSTVENAGIITTGIGLALIGLSAGERGLALCALAGALLHVLGHGVFKATLFLAAGSVIRGAGGAQVDRLGGLLRRMPATGGAFLAASASAAVLPPLCGFAGEFLILLAAFHAVATLGPAVALPSMAVIAGLALAGGLSAACFAGVFGTAFLGEPRGAASAAAAAAEVPRSMRGPMAALASACVLLGLASPWLSAVAGGAATALMGPVGAAESILLRQGASSLRLLVLVAAIGVSIAAVLAWLRARLLRGREVRLSSVWACGHAPVTARMQYTNASFTQPIRALADALLRTRAGGQPPRGLFPASGSHESATPDPVLRSLIVPFFQAAGRGLAGVRALQRGHVRIYVGYIAITLLVLLIWQAGRAR